MVWLGPALGVGGDAVHEGGDLGAAGGVVGAEGVGRAAGGYLVGAHPVDCGGVVGVGVDVAESCGGGGLSGLAGLDVAVQQGRDFGAASGAVGARGGRRRVTTR